ncbi:hypothetical protein D0544_16665 [Aestuariirhabdus litorea]|uniref:Cytoplasmic protein n=1 Tax=Aestuariirhabdus litorea TaxID=2528527 RepID=A0A3P3VPG5_9GAMM|nr:DUF3820 family protein [Aestuariirhabdus litorea]RRJ83546.1 hypothetical protein D0544_16665 [Aestuariirhabdus litorea]RWW93709.1 hypothetical protein DZC74_16635 [Endozoicomonadaceae bacterium GTF-13]
METPVPDPRQLVELVTERMPFGKYQGWVLKDLPEPYLVWFKQKGFPGGHLGQLLQTLYEVKLNGLEPLLEELSRRHRGGSG